MQKSFFLNGINFVFNLNCNEVDTTGESIEFARIEGDSLITDHSIKIVSSHCWKDENETRLRLIDSFVMSENAPAKAQAMWLRFKLEQREKFYYYHPAKYDGQSAKSLLQCGWASYYACSGAAFLVPKKDRKQIKTWRSHDSMYFVHGEFHKIDVGNPGTVCETNYLIITPDEDGPDLLYIKKYGPQADRTDYGTLPSCPFPEGDLKYIVGTREGTGSMIRIVKK